MSDCPHCEYHKNRAARWRAEAYKHAGYDIELPWVGLTDDELPALAGDNGKVMDLEQTRKFYKAIERLLKEKNT